MGPRTGGHGSLATAWGIRKGGSLTQPYDVSRAGAEAGFGTPFKADAEPPDGALSGIAVVEEDIAVAVVGEVGPAGVEAAAGPQGGEGAVARDPPDGAAPSPLVVEEQVAVAVIDDVGPGAEAIEGSPGTAHHYRKTPPMRRGPTHWLPSQRVSQIAPSGPMAQRLTCPGDSDSFFIFQMRAKALHRGMVARLLLF